MLLKIISIILCFLIVILCYLTRRKSELLKKKLYIVISIGVILLFLINIPGFMKAYFVGFDSPEDAYKYETGGKASLVLEGTITDYVFGNKDSVILEKDEKGWRIPKSSTMTAKAMKSKGEITVYVRQYNKTDEYYVTVLYLGKGELDIKDNWNSIFYLVNQNSDIDEDACFYSAYVNAINDEYKLFINGEEMLIFD